MHSNNERSKNTDAEIRHIYEQWHQTVVARDIDGLMALYADGAILETPLILAAVPSSKVGMLEGKAAIHEFFAAGLRKLPGELGRWYRTGTFFSNGRQLTWEYPRETPQGNQIDLVEVMDVADGLIAHHRVYWGWTGFQSLMGIRDLAMR